MNNFTNLTSDELMQVDGGAALEIMIGTKVFTGCGSRRHEFKGRHR